MKQEFKETGIKDRNGIMIKEGDFVSLDGNITTDYSTGDLPNGWTFDEKDVYEVYWDERIKNWSLKIGVEPDTIYNRKFMSHAINVLLNGNTIIIRQSSLQNQTE